MNDLTLNENCLKIAKLARQLSRLLADASPRKNLALFIALSNIELAAKRAQDKLNAIDFPHGFPEEQMGQ